jgi:hypothetical protein
MPNCAIAVSPMVHVQQEHLVVAIVVFFVWVTFFDVMIGMIDWGRATCVTL